MATARKATETGKRCWPRPAAMGVLLLAFAAAAYGASSPDAMPTGIDESEWERLGRPTAARGLPEFLSPEAMAGLSAEVIEAIQRDFAERGRIQVQSERYLDYNEERNIIYSNARTRIRFDRYMLEADRVLVNVPLQEIQAEGNVVLQAWRDPQLKNRSDEIHCQSMVFNYKYFQGVAHEARGQHDMVYFKCAPGPPELPAFRMIGRDEAIMRNVEITTCDFPDPQYHVRTRDAMLVFDDRLFMQGATLYVRHIPILYLPAYTKSLREKSPWHITFGRSSQLGTYVNVRYNFYHYRYEPTFEDPDTVELRDRGHAQAKLDLLSKRGVGMGLEYSYGFNFEKHRGEVAAYWLPSDRTRDVPDDRSSSRWQLFARHRSELRDDLILHLNVDYMSDPEVYYDLFDPIEQFERGRVPERQARAALTWWKEDYVARALFEVKERISRDRITNTADPWDDDLDYDPFPESGIWGRRHRKEEGLPADRYGLVSLRAPQLTFSTSHLRIGGQSPLFYTLDVNAFNNLDKGLNFNSTKDDSFVLGFDLYQQISYLFRFSKRYTLLAQIGAGLGVMKRLDDSYNWEPEDFLREDGTLRRDISFVDDSTYVTAYGREIALSDYSPAFAYADLKLRFQGRFTDSLTGNIYYIIREGSKESLSEFYESIGNRTAGVGASVDLYGYRIRKHWIEADLTHRLVYPDLTTVLRAGRNLQSQSDIYANEPVQYASIGTSYRNQARTLRLNAALSYNQTQIHDQADPNQYLRDDVVFSLGAAYAPVHRRWWVETALTYWKTLNEDPARGAQVETQLADEARFARGSYGDDSDFSPRVELWVGRKFGEKWTVEVGTDYQAMLDSLDRFYERGDARIIFTRNLHNALAQVQLRYKQRPWKDTPTEWDIKFNLLFKLPGPTDIIMAPQATTLISERRELEMAEDTL